MLWSSTELSVSGWIKTSRPSRCSISHSMTGWNCSGLKMTLSVGDRMRPDRLVAEAAELDRELLPDNGAQALSARTRLLRIVVDMGVIAPVRDGIGGGGYRALLAGWRFRWLERRDMTRDVDRALT